MAGNRKRTWPLWLGLTALALSAGLCVLLAFSPFRQYPGFPYPLVKTEVEVAAPPDSVFRFLGNSGNAARWSVFVDHISPLNADSIPDGRVSSRRRCFCQADETGRMWDEVITQVLPGQKRQILCYDLVDFPFAADGLGTEQYYEPLGANRCRLTFTLFYLAKVPTFLEGIAMRLAAYRVAGIFNQNMLNIKSLVEGRAVEQGE